VRRIRVEELVTQGQARAGVLQGAIDNLGANLAAMQLGVTISSLKLGWIGEPALARLIEPAFGFLGSFAATGSHAIAAGVAFAIITVFQIVLGELRPRTLLSSVNQHATGSLFYSAVTVLCISCYFCRVRDEVSPAYPPGH